jgi:hypothetical protein
MPQTGLGYSFAPTFEAALKNIFGSGGMDQFIANLRGGQQQPMQTDVPADLQYRAPQQQAPLTGVAPSQLAYEDTGYKGDVPGQKTGDPFGDEYDLYLAQLIEQMQKGQLSGTSAPVIHIGDQDFTIDPSGQFIPVGPGGGGIRV